MNKLRIIYMGTPDFAVAPLKKLIENNLDIVAVITAPDKPAGRGHKLSESPVKKFAKANNLPVLQPTNLKSENFLKELKTYKADLQIVVAFRMLPKIVWDMPARGTFNLHASLLPQYRGAAPINWAVINGDKESGVTTFFINENIDTGNILFQKKTKIDDNETAGDLHDRLMEIGSELVLKTVHEITANTITPVSQDDIAQNIELKPAPKIFKETCKINWEEDSIDNIYNQIRGFSPYPGAWFSIQDGDKIITPVKVFSATKELHNHQFTNGTINCNKEAISIYCNGGIIHITEIQIPGKRRMKSSDFLKGHQFSEGAIAQ